MRWVCKQKSERICFLSCKGWSIHFRVFLLKPDQKSYVNSICLWLKRMFKFVCCCRRLTGISFPGWHESSNSWEQGLLAVGGQWTSKVEMKSTGALLHEPTGLNCSLLMHLFCLWNRTGSKQFRNLHCRAFVKWVQSLYIEWMHGLKNYLAIFCVTDKILSPYWHSFVLLSRICYY